MTQPCRLVQAIVENPGGNDKDYWSCDLAPADASPETGYNIKLDGFDFSSGKDPQGVPFVSGETTFFAPGIQLYALGRARVPAQANAVFQRVSSRRLATVTGTSTFLAVRVVALDQQTTATESYVSDKIYGTSGDPVNLKTQLTACSNNQFIVSPANKMASTGITVNNGVVSILSCTTQ